MKENNLEIERKFLIVYPDLLWLEKSATRKLLLEQTYLLASEGESARVRKSEENGAVTYIKTIKKKITDISRVEMEDAISKEEYAVLLKQADPERRTITKVRYCVPYDGHVLEIDIFPFWKDKAYLEIELSREDETYKIPEGITVLKEVTGDTRYTNASLARSLPE